jgi:hypothetical protein
MKCTKCPLYIPNVQKIHQPFPFQGPPTFTQIGILGLKIYNLATLRGLCFSGQWDNLLEWIFCLVWWSGWPDAFSKNIAQSVAQHILLKLMLILNLWKSSQEMWATASVIFKNMPKVNNHPTAENSPNLVTLVMMFLFLLLSTIVFFPVSFLFTFVCFVPLSLIPSFKC